MSRASEGLPLPPLGLSRPQAAAHLGMGVSLFDQLVEDGRLPKPRQVQGRLIWHRREIENAFEELPYKGESETARISSGNSWAAAETRGRGAR